jgi:microcystin-dependent protein
MASSETLGMIVLYPSSADKFDQTNFRACNGQSLAVSDFQGLYAVIGNSFGGDSTNFKLPDLNSAIPFPGGKSPIYAMCTDGYFPGNGDSLEYMAVVKLYGGQVRLTSYEYCDGQTLTLESNLALFSLLENTYGGDYTKGTFNLPSLNDPAPFPSAPAVKYVICTKGVYPAQS